jgi:hypothetical protein
MANACRRWRPGPVACSTFARHAEYGGRGSETEVQALAQRWLAQDYSIHFHVWDHAEFSAALGRIQRAYVRSLAVVEACRNGSENIYILRKAAG